MYKHDGTRSVAGRRLERVEVDLPPVVVNQRVGNQLYVLQLGEKIEERIARLGDQNLVVGVRKQAKHKAVGFPAAGSQNERLRVNILSAFAIIPGNRLASLQKALRLRVVVERLWVALCLQN